MAEENSVISHNEQLTDILTSNSPNYHLQGMTVTLMETADTNTGGSMKKTKAQIGRQIHSVNTCHDRS
jgi:hypothetical protein